MKSLEELLRMARATGLSITLTYAFDTRGAGRWVAWISNPDDGFSGSHPDDPRLAFAGAWDTYRLWAERQDEA